MQVRLSERDAQIVERLVSAGEYQSAEAVVEAALELLQCEALDSALRSAPMESWESIRESLVRGERDYEAGLGEEATDEFFDSVFQEAMERHGKR